MRINLYYAHCSAREKAVRVVRGTEVLGQAPSTDRYPDPSDVVCLEYGTACTGELCPLFQVPSAEMARRLADAGLYPAGGR